MATGWQQYPLHARLWLLQPTPNVCLPCTHWGAAGIYSLMSGSDAVCSRGVYADPAAAAAERGHGGLWHGAVPVEEEAAQLHEAPVRHIQAHNDSILSLH